MKVKCEAKLRGISSYDLKRERAQVKVEEVEEEGSSVFPMIGCFGLTSATAFALTFAIMKAGK